ncbi:MAG TPA: tetratricopeptide repeat protein [Bryobacteraceae bacterium]|nr:tetratricopeptide repeat protein [Bryobacteraceae bacterium]
MRTLALALLAAALPLGAQDLVAEGFDHFYNLEYDQAIADFQKAIAQNSNSPDLHNHLAQTIVFQEMYRNGALESETVSGTNSFLRRPKMNPSPATEMRFLDEIDKAIALSEARLRKNPNDTGALYAEGISYGIRSDYYWVVKKSWHDSLRDATMARRLHNRISELEPNNVDARLVQGVHDYIVGSLPWHYRMLGFLIGIHGDKERGIRTVQDVAKHGKLNGVDAEIFLCAIYRRENRTRLAVPLVQDLIQRFPRNYLLRLELSQMYSMAGDGAHGLEAVEEVARLKSQHAPGYDLAPWPKIYFQEGTIEFWYNDLDRALENLKKVAAASADLDLNTGASAYLRIGQIYDMTHHRQEALEAYRKAIAYAPQADAAQESRKYLSTPYHRGS